MSEDNKKNGKVIMETANIEEFSFQGHQDDLNNSIVKNAGKNEEMMDLIKHASGSVKKGRAVPRIAFSENPQQQNRYAGIYKLKDRGLLPDNVVKRIRIENHLVASILRARGNTLSMMGHIRKDRFDVGIDCDVKGEFKDHIDPEQMVKVNERIDRFLKILINCGFTDAAFPPPKLLHHQSDYRYWERLKVLVRYKGRY